MCSDWTELEKVDHFHGSPAHTFPLARPSELASSCPPQLPCPGPLQNLRVVTPKEVADVS